MLKQDFFATFASVAHTLVSEGQIALRPLIRRILDWGSQEKRANGVIQESAGRIALAYHGPQLFAPGYIAALGVGRRRRGDRGVAEF